MVPARTTVIEDLGKLKKEESARIKTVSVKGNVGGDSGGSSFDGLRKRKDKDGGFVSKRKEDRVVSKRSDDSVKGGRGRGGKNMGRRRLMYAWLPDFTSQTLTQ